MINHMGGNTKKANEQAVDISSCHCVTVWSEAFGYDCIALFDGFFQLAYWVWDL